MSGITGESRPSANVQTQRSPRGASRQCWARLDWRRQAVRKRTAEGGLARTRAPTARQWWQANVAGDRQAGRHLPENAALLTLVLKRALGPKSITEYMQERLWNPLGMETQGSWSIDHAPDGLEKTGCCLATTARDVAKFGRLYLNKGLWDGRRIVSEAWVTESTRIDTSAGAAWNYQRMKHES